MGDAIQPELVREVDGKFTSTNAYLAKSDGKYAKAVSHPLNYGLIFVIAMMLGALASTFMRGRISRDERTMPAIWAYSR